MPNPADHKLTGRHLGETARALKFQIETINGNPFDAEAMDKGNTHWFPLTQVVNITKAALSSNDLDQITVKNWIMREKGLV